MIIEYSEQTRGDFCAIKNIPMQQNLGHLMVDIETMGNRSSSVICSIGAVEFDIMTGATGTTFYERISIQSCLDAGLKVDGSTIEWWLTKSEAARDEIAKGGSSLATVLIMFEDFIKKLGDTDNLRLWGNSVRFDMGILQDAFSACYLPVPWNTWKELDVRTVVFFNPEIKKQLEKSGTAHHPLDDCLYQIKYCHKILNSITVNQQTYPPERISSPSIITMP